MRGFYADRARELVDLMLAHFDVENVVLMLRAGAGTQRAADEALGALLPVGWLVEPLAGEILRGPELAGAIDLIVRRTPDPEQTGALRAALSEYERTGNLAALEHAVLAAHAAHVPPRSRPPVRTPGRCCGSRGGQSTSATSSSRCACAMPGRLAPQST